MPHVFLHIGEVAKRQQAYVFMVLLCFVYATNEVRHRGWAVGTCPALQLLAASRPLISTSPSGVPSAYGPYIGSYVPRGVT